MAFGDTTCSQKDSLATDTRADLSDLLVQTLQKLFEEAELVRAEALQAAPETPLVPV